MAKKYAKKPRKLKPGRRKHTYTSKAFTNQYSSSGNVRYKMRPYKAPYTNQHGSRR